MHHDENTSTRKKQDNEMETNEIHYALSVLVAASIGAEPLRCWRNAVLAMLEFPGLFASGAYVEGWIVVPREQGITIIEHGWCTSPEAGIVDPSIVLIEDRDQSVIYFPGFELSGERLSQRIAGKTVPLVCNSRYGRDGMRHQGYKQSYEKARQYARNLARERHLPRTAITVNTRDSKRGLTIITQR
jgi:hypothetical protein